jgi:hypothetical protein
VSLPDLGRTGPIYNNAAGTCSGKSRLMCQTTGLYSLVDCRREVALVERINTRHSTEMDNGQSRQSLSIVQWR